MWAATLLSMGAAAFGRLLVVNLMPSAILVLCGWITVRGAAIDRGNELTLMQALMLGHKVDTLPLLMAILLIAILAAMTQSFQLGFIRLLEGYWGSSRLGIALAGWGVRRRETYVTRLHDMQRVETQARNKLKPELADLSRRSAHVQRRLLRENRTAEIKLDSAISRLQTHYPPTGVPLLPTRLGNAMRSFEHRAGERYGYKTISTWPRLYHHLSERLTSSYTSSVDALHAAVNFTFAFALSAVVLAVGFWDDPEVLWLPGICLAATILAYRGALSAACMVGLMESVAYDLHRFDLLTGLRQKLPEDGTTELADAEHISMLLAQTDPEGARAYVQGLKYEHKRADDGSGSSKPPES